MTDATVALSFLVDYLHALCSFLTKEASRSGPLLLIVEQKSKRDSVPQLLTANSHSFSEKGERERER